MQKREYTVEKDGVIKEFLSGVLGFSSSFIKRAKYGHIYVNGETVHMRAPVRAGDRVTVDMADADVSVSAPLRPTGLLPDILYEDDDIVAVNKPCGMPTHPSAGNSLPTLCDVMEEYYAGVPFVFRAVGRLDRDTSGIVLLARHQPAAGYLAAAMQKGRFRKEYTAVTERPPSPPAGTVDAPIARECENALRRVVRPDGKRAVTSYEVLGVSESGHALVRLSLLTGRTHQIRVHMAYIGAPLLYDFLYGTKTEGETYRLHASALAFPHPSDGHTVTLTSAPPFLSSERFLPPV